MHNVLMLTIMIRSDFLIEFIVIRFGFSVRLCIYGIYVLRVFFHLLFILIIEMENMKTTLNCTTRKIISKYLIERHFGIN